jgi:hypothetical protein
MIFNLQANKYSKGFALIFLPLLLAGCSGIKLSADNPPGINFSGQWLIDFGDSDVIPDLRNRPPGKPSRRTRGSVNSEALRIADGSGLAFIAHDFEVLRADKVTIEQGRSSMGLDYEPGVYRDVSWGERQRGLWEVQAGWEDEQLVIISSSRTMRVVERLSLAGPDRLEVRLYIDADNEQLEFLRAFNRQP